jgi:ATP-dependent helicase HepA
MAQKHDDLSDRIISGTSVILADGRPRTARDIARDLIRFGLSVDKSLVNKVLYSQGMPNILYDAATHNYYLFDPNNTDQQVSPIFSRATETQLDSNSASSAEVVFRPENEKPLIAYTEPIVVPSSEISGGLLLGMFVRVPTQAELHQNTTDFRDYRIGCLIEQDNMADTMRIALWEHQLNSAPEEVIVTVVRSLVRRCRILPNTPCYHRPSQQNGIILYACDDAVRIGEFTYYYVSINGAIERFPEHEVRVASHRQDVDPVDQLEHYEFHNPTYRYHRDRLVQSYIQLNNATTGLEELVNTRVLLLAHQAEVITRALGDENCRYILADEVGLGKTIEACVILKGLLQRYGNFKTLVITPSALMHQWFNELNGKFWIRLMSWRKLISLVGQPFDAHGLIVSHEELESDSGLWSFLQAQKWGLLIVDEAHHVARHPILYDRIHSLSRILQRVLILSATPIQHRSAEYLSILRLMYPQRYDALSESAFSQIIAHQKVLYDVVETVRGSLDPAYFDTGEFADLMKPLREPLDGDTFFIDQLNRISNQPSDHSSLEHARHLVTYLSENYRVESRVIRNRRASLRQHLLPERHLDTQYAYNPSEVEYDTFNDLTLYVQAILSTKSEGAISFSQALIHSASSSPEALLNLIDLRLEAMDQSELPLDVHLLYPTSPRQEIDRLRKLVRCLPQQSDERRLLENLRRRAEGWREQVQSEVERFIADYGPSPHRLAQVLRAVQHLLSADTDTKVIIFTSWQATLIQLRNYLFRYVGRDKVAQFHVDIEPSDLQDDVDRFQSDSRCRIMLCDELGGEGRNFQIAAAIIHVDLPWSPTQIEQRIGRIDRLGRQGVVVSILPYAKQQLEEDMFNLMQQSFHVFTQSMSGLEIVVEEVQEKIRHAFAADPFEGLRRVLPQMQMYAEQMRREIELERIFEESAINQELRREIADISNAYQDGNALRESICAWGTQIGMNNRYDPESQVVMFDPQRFNFASMANAKLVDFPNMEDALERSGRKRQLVVRGSFNRLIAVKREDLVFFAPNGDLWTNVILNNALESERGRCSAVELRTMKVNSEWRVFDFLFTIRIDPRPLYAAKLPYIHLYKARGVLANPTYRLCISIDGQMIGRNHPVNQAILEAKSHAGTHLGKRSNGNITAFKAEYPIDEWEPLILEVSTRAWKDVKQVFQLDEEAEILRNRLVQQRNATQAVRQWLIAQRAPLDDDNNEMMEKVTLALVNGLLHPLIRLESICFWKVVPDNA